MTVHNLTQKRKKNIIKYILIYQKNLSSRLISVNIHLVIFDQATNTRNFRAEGIVELFQHDQISHIVVVPFRNAVDICQKRGVGFLRFRLLHRTVAKYFYQIRHSLPPVTPIRKCRIFRDRRETGIPKKRRIWIRINGDVQGVGFKTFFESEYLEHFIIQTCTNCVQKLLSVHKERGKQSTLSKISSYHVVLCDRVLEPKNLYQPYQKRHVFFPPIDTSFVEKLQTVFNIQLSDIACSVCTTFRVSIKMNALDWGFY